MDRRYQTNSHTCFHRLQCEIFVFNNNNKNNDDNDDDDDDDDNNDDDLFDRAQLASVQRQVRQV